MNTASKTFLNHSKHSQSVYLSGGIDSTLMTFFLQRNTSDPIDTYTLFDDAICEDRIYAKRVVREFKTNHHEHKANPEECMSWLNHYIYHYESLVTDGIFNVLGSLAFHILSHQISKKHKIAYCGEGADELFGGYYWMHTHPLGLGDRLRERSAQIDNGNTEINQYIWDHFPNDDAEEMKMKNEIFDMLMGPGLANCHLWSVDRSSSAFSFEARPFFLYDDLRDWALNISIESKVSKTKETKLILKQFANQTNSPLLKKIANRKKIGMPYALNASLKSMITLSLEEFRNPNKSDRPHMEYETYLTSNIEKYMFDKFYDIFIENRGISWRS